MIKIANAPCSWGVLEFDLEGESAGYPQVLDEIRDTGYAGTELGDWGFMPTNPSALDAELKARKLDLIGAFVPVALADASTHAEGETVALKTAKLMKDAGYGHAFIVLADDNGSVPFRTQKAGRITPDDGLAAEQWDVFASGANRIARAVQHELGMRTVFHHHCAGYVETPDEVTQLMSRTDPDVLGLVLDMGHYTFGGGDPLEALRSYSNRIWHIHFKDCHSKIAEQSRRNEWDYFKSVNKGVFCKLGEGEVDFPSIVQELKNQAYQGWIVVEQDVLPGMGDPKACARFNRQYIERLGL